MYDGLSKKELAAVIACGVVLAVFWLGALWVAGFINLMVGA